MVIIVKLRLLAQPTFYGRGSYSIDREIVRTTIPFAVDFLNTDLKSAGIILNYHWLTGGIIRLSYWLNVSPDMLGPPYF